MTEKNNYGEPQQLQRTLSEERESSFVASDLKDTDENVDTKDEGRSYDDLIRKIQTMAIPNLNINLNQTRYQVVRQCSNKLGWGMSEAGRGAWSISWHDCGGFTAESTISTLNSLQKINHFPGMSKICQKCKLGLTIARLSNAMPELFDFHPQTWCLPKEKESLRKWYQLEFASRKQRPVLIVKPDGGCQGNGIFLTNDLNDLADLQGLSAVQQYLPNPFLINGYKFDLRIYVLVTSCTPSLRAFQHREGLVRFCTVKYERPRRENLDNRYMHLTNYAVNKHNANYKDSMEAGGEQQSFFSSTTKSPSEAASDASKWSLAQLYDYLKARGHDVDEVQANIEDIVTKTLLSIQPSLAQEYRACFGKEGSTQTGIQEGFRCFEILGFDIMLDAGLQPWVIEVNHSPSLHCDAPLDQRIKEQVVRESLVLGCIEAEDLLAGEIRQRPTTIADQRERVGELLARRRGMVNSHQQQQQQQQQLHAFSGGQHTTNAASVNSLAHQVRDRLTMQATFNQNICQECPETNKSPSTPDDQADDLEEQNRSNQNNDETVPLNELRTAFEDAHCGGFKRILPYDPNSARAAAYSRIEAFKSPLMKENPAAKHRRLIIEKERQQLEAEKERVRIMIGDRPAWGGSTNKGIRVDVTEEEIKRRRAAKRRQLEQEKALALAAGKPVPLPRVASLKPFQRKFRSINPDGSALETSPRGEHDFTRNQSRVQVPVPMRIQTLQFNGF